MTYALGIDLGTTYSAAAVRRDGRTEMVGLGLRSLEAPSVVFLKEDGEFLVGEAAERRGSSEPGRLAREFKRRVGDPAPILLAGSPHSPQALTARLLRWVLEAVEAREGGPPSAIVITFPANWGAYKQDLLAQAIRLADVHDVRTVTEPEAAAVQYASTTRVAPGEVVAVYDLGGGTFDAAVLRKSEAGFAVIGAPEGIEHMGGIDFDEAVTGYVVDALGDAVAALDRTDPATLAGMARLRRDCVEAKEALSIDSEASVPVSLPGVQTQIRITRREFEAMIRPSLADTIGALRRALRSAELEPAALKAVVLVGGSGRIPLVSELVRAELGVPVAIDTHPKHGVAMGAALLAELVAGDVNASQAAGGLVAWPPPPLEGTQSTPAAAAPAASSAAASVADAAAATPVDRGPDASPPAPSSLAAPAAPRTRAASASPTISNEAAGGGAGPALAATERSAETVPPGPGEPPRAEPYAPGAGEPGRTAPGKRTALLVGGAVAVVVAVVVAVLALGGGDGGDATSATTAVSTTVATNAVVVPRSAVPFAEEIVLYTTNRAGTWDVAAINADGTGERTVLGGPTNDQNPSWSPDRRSMLFQRNETGSAVWELWMAAADGTGPVRISDELPGLARAAWSPDGTKVAFVSDREGQRDVWAFDTATGGLTALTDDAVTEDDPAWSPDGKQLALWRDTGTGADLYLLDVDASAAAVANGSEGFVGTRLTQDPAAETDPSFSPDGATLLFASDRTGNWDQYTMPVAGGESRQLTNDPADDVDASWSPDGRNIVFASTRSGGIDLYVMSSTDGAIVRRLTELPGYDGLPSWSTSSAP